MTLSSKAQQHAQYPLCRYTAMQATLMPTLQEAVLAGHTGRQHVGGYMLQHHLAGEGLVWRKAESVSCCSLLGSASTSVLSCSAKHTCSLEVGHTTPLGTPQPDSARGPQLASPVQGFTSFGCTYCQLVNQTRSLTATRGFTCFS